MTTVTSLSWTDPYIVDFKTIFSSLPIGDTQEAWVTWHLKCTAAKVSRIHSPQVCPIPLGLELLEFQCLQLVFGSTA